MPPQRRFLPWTQSGTGIARYNNWLVEIRRTTYFRRFLSDFHNLMNDTSALLLIRVIPSPRIMEH